MCVFLYFFCCCCCLFIFPFFSVVGFPFHPQFFFPMLHLLFLPFILLILLLICLKPHLQKSAFHPYETVRTSCMGHILNQLYFTSAWLLVTLLLCRKQWIRWRKNRSQVWFNFGAVLTNLEKKICGFKNVQIRVDMAFRPCLQHFVFFTGRVYKAGSGYPSSFRRAWPLACLSPRFRLVWLRPFQNKQRKNYLWISFLEKLIL